jgi:hypothetical protein
VATSAGYHTGLAVSDPFEIPDRPPEPFITSPLEEEAVPAGEPVALSGGAYDADDGSVDAEGLSWTVDGADAGSGGDQLVQGLAPGEHAVELTATDSVSQVAGTSVRFTVDTLQIPDGPEPILDGYCDDGAYQSATELQLSPQDEAQVTVHLLRNGADLYGCFNGVPHPEGEEDALVGLLLDGNGSADDLAQSNDYGFFLGSHGFTTALAGDGAGGFQEAAVMGLEGALSSSGGGWSGELRLDLSTLVVATGTVGIDLVHLRGEASSHWPYAAEAGSPATWAQTELGGAAPRVMLPIVLKGCSDGTDRQTVHGHPWEASWLVLPAILKPAL